VTGRIAFRGPAIDRPEPNFPDPLAVSPDGRWLVYGTATDLSLRNLGNGSVAKLPTEGNEVIRVRFDIAGDRVLLATPNGVVALSGPEWSRSHWLTRTEAFDARGLKSGYVAAATPAGVRLLLGHDSIQLYQGVTQDGVGAGTVTTSRDGAIAVPEYERLPLVVLRSPPIAVSQLCALAGGRAPSEKEGCGPRPPLPEPRAASGTAADTQANATLSASGLGDLRLGRALPPEVESLRAYTWGECAVRTLPGRGAMVISHGDEVESISTFRSQYNGAEGQELTEVATDRGLLPSYPPAARTLYGPPDEKQHGDWGWWLRRADGAKSLLTVKQGFLSPAPISMSLAHPECEGWE
jgi:hypothetical protein